MQPNSFGVLNENEYVFGGMEGGSQEETTNLHKKGTKGGSLPHVIHEGLNTDLSPYFRAFGSPRDKHTQDEPLPTIINNYYLGTFLR